MLCFLCFAMGLMLGVALCCGLAVYVGLMIR